MKTEKQTQGKKNRQSGARFELKVRKDLEDKGWIVDRWTNNVQLSKEYCGLIKAKSFMGRSRTNGFPDFICFKLWVELARNIRNVFNVIGVEVKSNGYLSKEEKEKCSWLLKNKVFSKILIAKKGEKRGSIEYKEFEK